MCQSIEYDFVHVWQYLVFKSLMSAENLPAANVIFAYGQYMCQSVEYDLHPR
jgi:hypothetical protein